MMNSTFQIGIDLGGTNIKGVLLNTEGEILEKLTQSTVDPETGEVHFSIWKQRIREMVLGLTEKAGQEVPVGLSAPGLPSQDAKAISYMPGRLQGLENFDWSAYLPSPKVKVLNDAVAALLAERNFGAAKGYQHVMMLTLGTGVGGAILIHGKPYIGNLSRAGHMGHISLNPDAPRGILNLPGTLEYFVGNETIPERSRNTFESTRALVDAYLAGDTFARQLWLETVKKLALGISSLINVLSPELVILGGGISRAKEALFDPLESLMAVYEWRPGGVSTPIVPAQMKEYAGAVGAAIYALEA